MINKIENFTGKFKCSFGRHDLELVKILSSQACKVRCKRCGRLFAYNRVERACVEWSKEFESFYENFNGLQKK